VIGISSVWQQQTKENGIRHQCIIAAVWQNEIKCVGGGAAEYRRNSEKLSRHAAARVAAKSAKCIGEYLGVA